MKRTNHKKINISRLVGTSAVLCAFLLLLLSPEASFEYMKISLKLCLERLIPSLFPFMIISDFLISSGAGGFLKGTFGRVLSLVFGTSPEGSFAVLLGFLCGFPIGAKAALKLHDDGKISRRELLHIMSFCNIPSPAFVCGTVGMMFDSDRFGVVLYVSLLLSSIILGLLGRLFYKYERRHACASLECDFTSAFTKSVTSSASVMISVCAYVVFFSVLIGYVSGIFRALDLPAPLSLFISGMLEISNGTSLASTSSLSLAPTLTSFFAGFSGLSVICQILSLDRNGDINKKIFILQKLLQGALCAGITFLALKIFPCNVNTSTPTLEKISFESYGLYIGILFFITAVLPLVAMRGLGASNENR